MKAIARLTGGLAALSLAFATASAPASAAHRSITATNDGSKVIHMFVVAKTPDGVANVWSGLLDSPLGAHPHSAALVFEDHGEPFQIVFSGHGCDISTEIDPHRVAHAVHFKNCSVTVR
jgi:hypothetical protein